MTKDRQSDLLLDLYKHDVAACDVYKEVLSHIEDDELRNRITEFLHDHQEHVRSLEAAYEKRVGSPPARGIDIKGTMLFGYASMRSMTGQEGAIKALQTAERVLLKRYEEAAAQEDDYPEDIAKIINKDLKDEQRHNAYIDDKLSS
jgi:rubrerythrin